MNVAGAVWTLSLQKVYRYCKRIFSNNSTLKTYTVKSGDCKGIKLKLNNAYENEYKNIISGAYEDFLITALKEKGTLKDKTIWDIGAHIGFQTFSFARNVGDNGFVYSFEPNPNNFNTLRENTVLNKDIGNIHPLRLAVSDKKTIMPFQISKHKNHPTTLGGYLSDVIPPEEKGVYKDFDTINVNVNSIDNLIYTENLKFPDIIKIDIEGAELKALHGAKKVLGSDKKPVLIIEIHTISMMYHVLNFLSQFGYESVIIDDHIDFHTKNIICTPRKIQELMP